MVYADFWGPLIRQVRFYTVSVSFGYCCPSYIKTQMFILLYLSIPPVVGYVFLDISLINVHHRRICPPMPDHIDTIPIVEMLMI